MSPVPVCDECLETPMSEADDDYDCVGDPPRYVRTNRRVCEACMDAEQAEAAQCDDARADAEVPR